MFLLLIPTLSFASDEYEDPMVSVLNHWYAEVCPYGNAIVTDQKKHMIGTPDCVYFDYKHKRFSMWDGSVERRRNFKQFDPKHVRIFVVDGELILDNNGHPKVVEYGAMTITDPRFPEWIKTH